MSKKGFEKFISKELKGAKKKEAIRQEKKQYNREKRAFFEEQKRLKRLQENGGQTALPRQSKQADKTYQGSENKKTYQKKTVQEERYKSFEKKDAKPVRKNIDAKYSPIKKNQPENNTREKIKRSETTERQNKPIKVTAGTEKKAYTTENKTKTDFTKTNFVKNKGLAKDSHTVSKPSAEKKSFDKYPKKDKAPAEKMPLNKYLAHAGVCARREAAEFIKTGTVKVNNTVITEPGYKVQQGDAVSFKGKTLQLQHRLVYVLLNKPKDCITTSKDPEGRRTVFELVHNATDERIYPVGRLDRNTTGVLLFTNDGELAQRLTHPSFQVRKIYEVKLNKELGKEDFQKLSKGITLDDGFIQPDALGYADERDKTRIGIEIHSGRNRIVRRMFEKLGYDVRNLDRVLFANLTKKNIERGHWRHLTEKEVRLLKYMNKSFIKKETK